MVAFRCTLGYKIHCPKFKNWLFILSKNHSTICSYYYLAKEISHHLNLVPLSINCRGNSSIFDSCGAWLPPWEDVSSPNIWKKAWGAQPTCLQEKWKSRNHTLMSNLDYLWFLSMVKHCLLVFSRYLNFKF